MEISLLILTYLVVGLFTDIIYFKFISDYKYDPDDVEDSVGAILIMAMWPFVWILVGTIFIFRHLFKRIL